MLSFVFVFAFYIINKQICRGNMRAWLGGKHLTGDGLTRIFALHKHILFFMQMNYN